ncbi:MAG: ERF family protein [bacterium]|nr:ERF family protein [bacterium]
MKKEEMTITQKLCEIQTKLKAPKGQYNSFGKYKYRNCEDILESVKPLLNEYGLIINLSDEVVVVGERYYVQATATITDGNASISTQAYAREEEAKKGMDGSQVTGASSSYARKYALNGLFAIDDTKDSDTTNTGESKKTKATTTTAKQPTAREQVIQILKQKGIDINAFAKEHNLTKDTTEERYKEVLKGLKE